MIRVNVFRVKVRDDDGGDDVRDDDGGGDGIYPYFGIFVVLSGKLEFRFYGGAAPVACKIKW